MAGMGGIGEAESMGGAYQEQDQNLLLCTYGDARVKLVHFYN